MIGRFGIKFFTQIIINNKHKITNVILITIPLLLSAFVHLWNASLFPAFHPDEGVYIRRALHVLEGLGPQDPASGFDHSQQTTSGFDHPYFGQIFLAGIFYIIGFPESFVTGIDTSSIGVLYSVPRIIMGIMAIIDTFLLYKITEEKFNKHVAFFAAVLFAVMPLTWLLRRIVLDSIMLPLILSSIFFALKIKSIDVSTNKILIMLSGIFLGLSIFTKVPSFTLIPLVGCLIYAHLPSQTIAQNHENNRKTSMIIKINKKKIKFLCLWLIPVIGIPIIWPVYAIFIGEFNNWVDGVLWQASERKDNGRSLVDIASSFWKIDPLLFILGIAGSIYCTYKRHFIVLIWIVPYIVFLYFVGWITHFHLILLIPIVCIAIAKLIYDIPSIRLRKSKYPFISYGILSIVLLIGLLSSILIISVNLSYIQIYSTAFIAQEIFFNNYTQQHHPIELKHNDVTIIAGPTSSWIYKYVYNHEKTFSHPRDTQPITTSKIILLVDSVYKRVVSNFEGENLTQTDRLKRIYNETEIIALFKEDESNYNKKDYPFFGFNSASIGAGSAEIRSNY